MLIHIISMNKFRRYNSPSVVLRNTSVKWIMYFSVFATYLMDRSPYLPESRQIYQQACYSRTGDSLFQGVLKEPRMKDNCFIESFRINCLSNLVFLLFLSSTKHYFEYFCLVQNTLSLLNL